MKDYRIAYEKALGNIPDDFDIHHIDFNRKNNNINNLLMLPTWLHEKYHESLLEIEYFSKFPITKILPCTNAVVDSNEQYLAKLKVFNSFWYECSKWADYKEYKLGNLENIHDINI